MNADAEHNMTDFLRSETVFAVGQYN